MGHSVLESYSRVLESLANTVMSRIEDVLYADAITRDPSLAATTRELALDASLFTRLENFTSPKDETEKLTPTQTPTSLTLFDYMGWKSDKEANDEDKSTKPSKIVASKRFSYIDKLEAGGLRSPTARH